MKEQTCTYWLESVPPEPVYCDFEGVRLKLYGPLAVFYRWFRELDCEEAAQREFYPWLKAEKRKKEAAQVPTSTAPAHL